MIRHRSAVSPACVEFKSPSRDRCVPWLQCNDLALLKGLDVVHCPGPLPRLHLEGRTEASCTAPGQQNQASRGSVVPCAHIVRRELFERRAESARATTCPSTHSTHQRVPVRLAEPFSCRGSHGTGCAEARTGPGSQVGHACSHACRVYYECGHNAPLDFGTRKGASPPSARGERDVPALDHVDAQARRETPSAAAASPTATAHCKRSIHLHFATSSLGHSGNRYECTPLARMHRSRAPCASRLLGRRAAVTAVAAHPPRWHHPPLCDARENVPVAFTAEASSKQSDMLSTVAVRAPRGQGFALVPAPATVRCEPAHHTGEHEGTPAA